MLRSACVELNLHTPPEPGQLVTVRDRQWVVADVSRGSQFADVLAEDGVARSETSAASN
jgi:hypothetical protein